MNRNATDQPRPTVDGHQEHPHSDTPAAAAPTVGGSRSVRSMLAEHLATRDGI